MPFFDRLKIRRALIGYVILAAGTLYAIHGKVEGSQLKAGLEGSCQRVQVVRAQSNVSDSVSFNILALTAKRELELAKLASKRHVTDAANVHLQSGLKFAAQANKLTVTPLTNCDRAVNDAKNYKFPLAQPMGNPYDGTLTPAASEILDQSQRFLKLTAKKNSG